MSEPAKAYEPSAVEPKWYAAWNAAGAFRGVANPDQQAYTVVIPPPNVTGILTMGHVLNNTVQDILVRRARLEGKASCWIPGTDHAGIATQTRVERDLWATEKKTRRELGREAFVERIKSWRDEHGGIILKQLQHLGASCDWERTAYTLDPDYSRAVLTAFVELYHRGHVYRGRRMANWCPKTQTALSDEEVTMKPVRGTIVRMRYELVVPSVLPDGSPLTHLEIATTRPETIMGDVAVAVHPDDERYQHLIGQHIWRPFPRAQIPIIGDTAVDQAFGSGVLKVTPAHDPVDYAIGQRHGLPNVDVLNPDGTLNDLAGPEFAGRDRFEVRKLATARLAELGLLVKEEPYENNVGYSERGDVPIEPRLTEQWWLRYPKVEEAKFVVREGLIKFWPERWEKTYLHWLDNLQDWCLSRQLWWGHRIPIWYRKGASKDDPANLHVSVDGPADPENWEQEEDVLDTWASSWLWPLATLGWPDADAQKQRGFASFYPTETLVTGPDIIFFWVARMIIASLEFQGEATPDRTAKDIAALSADERAAWVTELQAKIPFRHVYFTGIIRDAQGRKMSKSLGNSPDPFDLIAKFGADGLRFGVMNIAPKGQDILFSEDRVSIGRNFCNKLWNAARFRHLSGPAGDRQSAAAIVARLDPDRLEAADRWILDRLVSTTQDLEKAFATFEFSQLTQVIYSFFWSDFCDWYVEAAKVRVQGADTAVRDTCLAVQDLVFRQLLLLLEPICPFITEELWQTMGFAKDGQFLQMTPVESAERLRRTLAEGGVTLDADSVSRMVNLQELVTLARGLKAQYNLAARRDVKVLIAPSDAASQAVMQAEEDLLRRLVGAASITVVTTPPDGAPAALGRLGTVALDLAASVDVVAEKRKLEAEIAKLDGVIASSEARLANPTFTEKAPPKVIEGAKSQLADNRQRRTELERMLASLGT